MCRSTLIGLDPDETYLAQREGNFAEVLAFAADRACRVAAVEDGTSSADCGPESTCPTVKVSG